MKSKSVTVDFLHPAVVRTFKNWGYISFFGCLAALIVLLFFSISYLKGVQAQQQTGRSVTGTHNSAPTPELQSVKPPYVYRNDTVGFSINYTPLIEKAGLIGVKTLMMRTSEFSGGIHTAVVSNSSDHSYEGGSPWPIFVIKWVADQRSMKQYEADERSRFIQDYGSSTAASLINFDLVTVGSTEFLRIAELGFCDNDVYTFFNKGYRVQLSSQCAGKQGRDIFTSVLHSLVSI
jgi:hypothetical protein